MTQNNISAMIGSNIRTARKKADKSLQAVADAAGITPGILSRVENGLANLSISTLFSIAEALDTDIAYLMNEHNADDLVYSTICERINYRKRELDLSEEDLAADSGLGLSYIKRCLNDEVIPSIPALLGIAQALKVEMDFFFPKTGDRQFDLSRTGARVQRSFIQPHNDQASYEIEMLFDKPTTHFMDSHITTYCPGKNSGHVKASVHGGQELVIVLEGTVELVLGGEKVRLEKYDAVYYDSNVSHMGYAVGDEPAKSLNVHFSSKRHIRSYLK